MTLQKLRIENADNSQGFWNWHVELKLKNYMYVLFKRKMCENKDI